MKRSWSFLLFSVLVLLLLLVPVGAGAVDYMVDFMEEKYREEPEGARSPAKIYHTLQVDSKLGSKLLILGGRDSRYRIWLRQYLVDNDRLILKVPEGADSVFRNSRAYETDVSMLHPVDGEKWRADEPGLQPKLPFKGQQHVLIVDANPERRRLLQMVVDNLGYPVTVSASGTKALNLFNVQPDKYCLVIMDNTLPEISGAGLVEKMIKTEPDIPVILGTGYKRKAQGLVHTAIGQSDKVVVKPVILRELSKTIIDLLGNKA